MGAFAAPLNGTSFFSMKWRTISILMCYRDYGALLAASRRQFAKPRLEYASRLSSR